MHPESGEAFPLPSGDKPAPAASPVWFRVALVAGLALRLYLAVCTEGTYDVGIWGKHAAGIQKYGLVSYYHQDGEMNHPPFIGLTICALARFSRITGIPFSLLLRVPAILADAGSLALLLRMLPHDRYRLATASLYWLNPLTIILSGYQGNTDPLVAFFLLLSIQLLSEQKVIRGAAALGVSLWVKLPGLLALPALLFFVPGWRRRVVFASTAGLVGISTYVPALLADAGVVWANVFAYRGQIIQTTAGQPVWGTQILLEPVFEHFTPEGRVAMLPYLSFYLNHDTWFCVGLVLLLCWLRRSKRTTRELALTIAGVYAIVYAFSNHWSFQYFAWSIPFWCLASGAFATGATLFAGAYVYGLYAYLCGNPWLLGAWDFVGHAHWPKSLEVLRDGALLFFLLTACLLLAFSAAARISLLYKRVHSAAAGTTTDPGGQDQGR